MTTSSTTRAPARRMTGRDIHEAHRVSTPLELLFDLAFVVAIALAGAQLHHAVLEHHLAQGLVGYVTTFAAVWWAWMAFTWFASAYDTDDAPYRLCTMIQMVGVLVLAAGVPKASTGDFATLTFGYVIMRVGMVALWWRAARQHPERRATAMRYVLGTLFAQSLWVARLAFPITWGPAWIYGSWFVLFLTEIAVPVWAARAGHTPWHAHHIAERYGLFTIIVLGECVLGATNAVASHLEARGWTWDLAGVGFGSAALVLSLWWVYFLAPFGHALHHNRKAAFLWGYGHFVVFASLAAMGAFLGVVADQLKGQGADLPAAGGHAPVAPAVAIGLVAASVAIYITAVGLMTTHVAGLKLRFGSVWFMALAVLAGVVIAVGAGLPLPWALPALALAPALIIAAVERQKNKSEENAR